MTRRVRAARELADPPSLPLPERECWREPPIFESFEDERAFLNWRKTHPKADASYGPGYPRARRRKGER
ncbi:MAG: hypothetical protein ACREQJ_11765 [Candidatus Binatia bacterium]